MLLIVTMKVTIENINFQIPSKKLAWTLCSEMFNLILKNLTGKTGIIQDTIVNVSG